MEWIKGSRVCVCVCVCLYLYIIEDECIVPFVYIYTKGAESLILRY